MTVTLGISAFYHDAAAALVRDGEIVAAASEERFSRRKGDPGFPVSAISYCLEQANMLARDLDSVVFYDKPVRTFDRLISSYLHVAPRGLQSWLRAMPRWSSEKLHIKTIIQKSLSFGGPVLFTEHHLAHAGAAFYPSPFEEAAILTIDGVGEWATASIGFGQGEKIAMLIEMQFPHSLGLLYSAITYYCGFKVNSGEYKLMGLAPYGEPRYVDLLKDNVVKIADDGSIELNLDYFAFIDRMEMTSPQFDQLMGGKRRVPESRITKREMDLAASIQMLTEDVVLKMAQTARHKTRARNLCLAGGVALNCVANGKLLRSGIFDDIWIQPAAGDAGSALGAALCAQHDWHGIARPPLAGALDRQRGSFLGPAFSEREIEAFLTENNHTATYISPDDRADVIARALAEGAVVGFFNGRMEFGPRSLGARSILGDPRRVETQRVMNLSIKYRESFRPFAPSVLAEDVSDYFELDRPSPYMLLVAPVLETRREARGETLPSSDDLLEAVNQKRSDIPSVTHWDYSARVQTVHRETNPLFHGLLSRFKELTGYSVVVNTSFNVRGEPIVCTPRDAVQCFLRTEMDFLYLEGYWLDKTNCTQERSKEWQNTFTLD
jgi:carbamoyltransferase